MFQANPANKAALFFTLLLCTTVAYAGPGDDQVEQFLREQGMDQLLEVQLESRLLQADDDDERREIAESLSSLYLAQLRAVERDDPYREVVVLRAQSLVDRMALVPLRELRLELLVDTYVDNEHAIELAQLQLLSDTERARAVQMMQETRRGLSQLLYGSEQEIERLARRRTQARTLEAQTNAETELENMRRVASFGNYYLGWSGYGLAVLEGRHVDTDTYKAFGWLLGAEGSIPQSKNLGDAALEYDHVARSALGIAACDAQSEEYSLSLLWLDAILDTDAISELVLRDVKSRKLRALTQNEDWYKAKELLIEMSSSSDAQGVSVADARFVAITTLRSDRSAGNAHASDLVKLSIEQLVEQREIGQIVDLYQRFNTLPQIGKGFIPSYANALSELNRAESQDGQPLYRTLIELFTQAIQAPDASEYPEHRDDCRLKLAYVMIRADDPKGALVTCQQVLDSSLDAQAIEEARWLRIAAIDQENTLSGRSGSAGLEQAIRSYIERYPGSERTRTLVLRYALRGIVGQEFAVQTLRSVPDSDPNAIAAKRLRVQLQYQMLRSSGFQDLELVRDTRNLAMQVIEGSGGNPDFDPRSILAMVQIATDLALRDSPPDPTAAERLIERARSLSGAKTMLDELEPELVLQLIRAALVQNDFDRAGARLDELRSIDSTRAEDAEVLILNTLIAFQQRNDSVQIATLIVEYGVEVIERVVPRVPERFGVQSSALMETVASAADTIHNSNEDQSMRRLALRLSEQVLEYGQASETGLRFTAELAESDANLDLALQAWLRLLAAYPTDDPRWYESRYHSLRLMLSAQPAQAIQAYKQYRVLNPSPAPEPWGGKIEGLFTNIDLSHAGDRP